MSGGVIFEILTALFAVYGLYGAIAEVKLLILRAIKRREGKVRK